MGLAGRADRVSAAPLRIVPDWRGRKPFQFARLMRTLATGTILEPFGGSGVISLNCGGVAWNDLDRRLLAVAAAIRDDCGGFAWRCQALPWQPNQQEAADALRAKTDPDDCDPAVFAWLCNHTLAGRLAGRVHLELVHGEAKKQSAWRNWQASLPAVSARLKSICLTSIDALDFIADAPSGHTIYADPPYEGAAGYDGGEVDHGDLLAALEGYDGQVVLSGFDEPPAGWDSLPFEPVRRAAIITQGFQTAENERREWVAWRGGCADWTLRAAGGEGR